MIKMYILKTIFVLSLSMFFYFSLFSQVAVVGFADGFTHVGQGNLTSFPTNLQLDKLTHVIAVGLGINASEGTFKR